MRTRDVVRPTLQERGGMFLENGESEVLLLDRLARGVLALPESLTSPAEVDRAKALVENLYQRSSTQFEDAFRFRVHVAVEDLREGDLCDMISELLVTLLTESDCELHLHFSDPPENWTPLLRWVYRIVKRSEKPFGRVTLQGPFDLLQEKTKAALFALGIHLGFVTGWWRGFRTTGEHQTRFGYDPLRDLAGYGFRIPVIHYVHSLNIEGATAFVEARLVDNQNSGVSLPLVCHHLHYEPTQVYVSAADTERYVELLKRVYEQVTFCDDTFFPISELARFVGSGAWNPQTETPFEINLLVRGEQKRIAFFRQIPAFASDCGSISGLLARRDHQSLSANLLAQHKRTFRWHENSFCGQCNWRYLCGGVDGWAPARPIVQTLEAVCVHRKAFLDTFVREKASLLVAEKGPRA